MKNEDIYMAFGAVSDEDLKACEKVKKGRRRAFSWIAAGIAACLAAVAVIPLAVKTVKYGGVIGNHPGQNTADVFETPEPLPRLVLAPIAPSGSEGVITGFSLSPDAAISRSDEVMIFRTYPAAVPEELIEKLAEKLGMEAYEIKLDENGVPASVTDEKGNSIFVISESGTIACSTSKENESVHEPVELPSDEECIRIAREWIDDLGSLTQDHTTKEPLVGDNDFVTKTVNGQTVRFPTKKTVTFMYKDLDGLEVNGVAPRIIVDISPKGEVVSVMMIRRDFLEYRRYPVISPEEALKNIQNGVGAVYCTGKPGGEGTVTSVRLAYYNPEAATEPEYLYPVYIFEGESGEGSFTAVTYALSEEYYEEADIQ